MDTPSCTLCGHKLGFFLEHRGKAYFKCDRCVSIQLSPDHYLSNSEEFERYKAHRNDVNDPGYKRFVWPFYQAVFKDFKKSDQGLDFGCGPGPAISKMLSDSGYNVKLYDPFFADVPSVLNEKYNYIFCSEVVEHFKKPAFEFSRLKSMLKPGGKLICMTSLYREEIDFANWYYKNDSTHMFFYSKNTFEWIKSAFSFSGLDMQSNLITLLI